MQKFILIVAGLIVVGILTIVFVSWRRPLAVAAYLHRRELAKAGVTKKTISTSAGIQTVFEGGTGPTVILLHGAGDQAGAWAKVVPALVSQYHVVIPDLAGHGDSQPKTGPLSVATIFRSVEQLAEKQPGKLILVGNSLGAWLATLYAHDHPERIERIVLVNGGALMGDRPDLILAPKDRDEARKLLREIMDPGNAELPNYVVDDIVREAQTGALMRLSQTASEMPKFLLTGRFHEVRTPTDLLWGEADRMMSLDYAKRLQQQMPAAQLTTLPRCGHAPQMECPKAFTKALIEILASPLPQPQSAVLSTGEAK